MTHTLTKPAIESKAEKNTVSKSLRILEVSAQTWKVGSWLSQGKEAHAKDTSKLPLP